jgi:hypothetical protein
MHSGWGALVAVSKRAEALEVIDRRRVTVTTPGTPGANEPYHFAENLEVQQAEKFLADCFAISKRLALPPLPKIPSSHALIHAAEGEFFRAVFSKTCEELELPVTGIPEHSLNEYIQRAWVKWRIDCCTRFRCLAVLSGRPGPRIRKPRRSATLVLAKQQGRMPTRKSRILK